jgi:hypothetical protein
MKQAEEAARKLKALLSSAVMSQLLQPTPPAGTPPAALTAEQEAQLSRCCTVIDQLQAALDQAPTLRLQLMDAMLKQKAAYSVGSLVTWVQQQPEKHLLILRSGSAPLDFAAGGTAASIWAAGVLLLGHFAAVAMLHCSESAAACSSAADLTQQLDQSGEACSRNCRRTAR